MNNLGQTIVIILYFLIPIGSLKTFEGPKHCENYFNYYLAVVRVFLYLKCFSLVQPVLVVSHNEGDFVISESVNMMEKKVKLKTVNPHICCTLCKGYLVEATTITECLHTCKCHVHWLFCTILFICIMESQSSLYVLFLLRFDSEIFDML